MTQSRRSSRPFWPANAAITLSVREFAEFVSRVFSDLGGDPILGSPSAKPPAIPATSGVLPSKARKARFRTLTSKHYQSLPRLLAVLLEPCSLAN